MTVELLAKAWAATLIVRHGDEDLLDAYSSSRLRGQHGSHFGTLATDLPIETLARRAVPAL